MKNFLKNIGNSIHNPKFYAGVPKKSFKSTFSYFFLLILLLTSIHTAFLTPTFFAQIPADLKVLSQDIVNCFPKDLEININNGMASSSAAEPYFINCKSDKPLIVIDTKTPYDSQKFKEYNSEAWLTKDSVVYQKNNYETRSYSLEKIKDFKLNQETLNSFKAKFEPYLKFVGPVLLILAFLGIYLSYIFNLIHILLIAALIWLLSKLFKKELSYSASYKVGLFAITLGLIVDLVISLTHKYTHFTGFPFMTTVLTLAVVFVNLFQNKEKS